MNVDFFTALHYLFYVFNAIEEVLFQILGRIVDYLHNFILKMIGKHGRHICAHSQYSVNLHIILEYWEFFGGAIATQEDLICYLIVVAAVRFLGLLVQPAKVIWVELTYHYFSF